MPSKVSAGVSLLFADRNLQNIYGGIYGDSLEKEIKTLKVYVFDDNYIYDGLINDFNSVLAYICPYVFHEVLKLKISDVQKLKTVVFLSSLYARIKHNSGCDKLKRGKNWAQLYSKLLEENYNSRDLPLIRDILRENKVIEIDHTSKCKGDVHSKSFRITDSFINDFIPARVTFFGGKAKDNLRSNVNQFWAKAEAYELEKAKSRFSGPDLEVFLRRRDYLLRVQSLLTISPELEGYLIDSSEAEDCGQIIYGLERFKAKRWTATTDAAGRWYHLLTSVKKEIRKVVCIAGEETVELDYKSLHPFLASKLYPADCPEKEVYLSYLKEGTFYAKLAEMVEEQITDDETKANFKTRVFQQIFFGKNWEQGYPLLRKFKERFPVLTAVMKEMKGGEEEFAVTLQRMEAAIMITGVLDELISRKIPVLTVHDSVICRKSDSAAVGALMITHFFDSVGILPIIPGVNV